MTYIFTVIFYQPLLNLLIFLYKSVSFGDLGLAIVFLTFLVRLVLFPLFQKSQHHQTVMQRIQPEIQRIQAQHKGDREKQAQALMELYRENEINPFLGFFFLLIQIPIMFALYRILYHLTAGSLDGLYSFVTAPASLNFMFLGLINLAKSNIIIVALAALAQYLQGKMAMPKVQSKEPSAAESMNRTMLVVAPLMTLFIFYRLPSAIALYWLAASVFSIAQQAYINRKIENGKVGTNTK